MKKGELEESVQKENLYYRPPGFVAHRHVITGLQQISYWDPNSQTLQEGVCGGCSIYWSQYIQQILTCGRPADAAASHFLHHMFDLTSHIPSIRRCVFSGMWGPTLIHLLSANQIIHNLLLYLDGLVQPGGVRSLNLLCILVPRQAWAGSPPWPCLQSRPTPKCGGAKKGESLEATSRGQSLQWRTHEETLAQVGLAAHAGCSRKEIKISQDANEKVNPDIWISRGSTVPERNENGSQPDHRCAVFFCFTSGRRKSSEKTEL